MSEQSNVPANFDKKQEVVTQMLALGNQRLVASLTGVKYETISAWKKQEWWKELEQQIKVEKSVKLDTKLSDLVDRSLSIVQDRLENGEIIMNNKTGELVRKPVGLRDTSRVAVDLLARQHIINKDAEDRVERQESMKETLSALAKEFAKWAKKDKAEDIEYVEVVPPEEET